MEDGLIVDLPDLTSDISPITALKLDIEELLESYSEPTTAVIISEDGSGLLKEVLCELIGEPYIKSQYEYLSEFTLISNTDIDRMEALWDTHLSGGFDLRAAPSWLRVLFHASFESKWWR